MGEEERREELRSEREEERRGKTFSNLQVANSGDDVLIFYNDHAFSTLLRLMKEDRDDALSLSGKVENTLKPLYQVHQ